MLIFACIAATVIAFIEVSSFLHKGDRSRGGLSYPFALLLALVGYSYYLSSRFHSLPARTSRTRRCSWNSPGLIRSPPPRSLLVVTDIRTAGPGASFARRAVGGHATVQQANLSLGRLGRVGHLEPSRQIPLLSRILD